jgi:hypothetical protein
MSREPHAERILDLLARTPGLDDDQIAQVLSIEPRQTVNQVCRRLAAGGVLVRERGPGGKIVNRLGASRVAHTTRPTADFRRVEAALQSSPATALSPGRSLVPLDPTRTLLVIPCSGDKDRTGIGEGGASISEHLPADLAQELCEARERVSRKIRIDESTLVPAWQRYNGALYQKGRQALFDLARFGCHVVILSGGYGALLADEPIGMYNARLKRGWWPNRILERVLIAYAKRHGLSCVHAFASATGDYPVVLRRVG